MRLYVNGELEESASGPGLYQPNGPQNEDFHIGAGADNGSQFFFDGLIDDVALWDEALSIDQVRDVTSLLKGDLATVLSLRIPSEASGDND